MQSNARNIVVPYVIDILRLEVSYSTTVITKPNRSVFGKAKGKNIVAPFSGHGDVRDHFVQQLPPGHANTYKENRPTALRGPNVENSNCTGA